MKKFRYIFVACVTGLLGLALASCNAPPKKSDDRAASSAAPQPDDRKFTEVAIKGQKEHLKQFDEKLKELLGFQDLTANEIGCYEGCEAFTSDAPLTITRYAFPRDYPDIYATFTTAWLAVQESSMDGDFTIEFDNAIVTPDCTGANNPPPCSSMTFCAIDRCGRKPVSASSCDAC